MKEWGSGICLLDKSSPDLERKKLLQNPGNIVDSASSRIRKEPSVADAERKRAGWQEMMPKQ